MQILEQLAYGCNDVTESDITMEYASIMGYLECMDEMINNNILTESVVIEGFGSTMINALKYIFEKVVGFLKKVLRFLSGRNRKTKNETPEEITGLTEEELAAIFEENPYTGINALTLKPAVSHFNEVTLENIHKLDDSLNNIINKIQTYNHNDGNYSFGKLVAFYPNYDHLMKDQRESRKFTGLEMLTNNIFKSNAEFMSITCISDEDKKDMDAIWETLKKRIDELKDRIESSKSYVQSIADSGEFPSKFNDAITKGTVGWAQTVMQVGDTIVKAYTKYENNIATMQTYHSTIMKLIKDAEKKS